MVPTYGLIVQSTNLQDLDASRRVYSKFQIRVFLLAALLHISKGPGMPSAIVVCFA